jgi:hypothetical protein
MSMISVFFFLAIHLYRDSVKREKREKKCPEKKKVMIIRKYLEMNHQSHLKPLTNFVN